MGGGGGGVDDNFWYWTAYLLYNIYITEKKPNLAYLLILCLSVN